MSQQSEPMDIGLVDGDLKPAGRIGVIDLGSNSGRLVVYDQYSAGYLNIVDDARVPLRLANDLHHDGRLSEEALERTINALREFRSIANGAGAERVIIVGTASMREATNGAEFLTSVRHAIGVDIDVIDGQSEALYSFLGAVHGLPVWDGFVLDIGGGSLELTRFRDRRLLASWTLPLGALRMTTEFIRSDPPARKDVRNLKRFVARTLAEHDVPSADSGDVLVGTGGTIRNIAKIDRKHEPSPIERLHGHALSFQRVRRIASSLASTDAARRAATPGLNSDRSDSIVGGAIAVQVVMEKLGMTELVVSGKGLREGIAFALNGTDAPTPDRVKMLSVASLARRFTSWAVERAEQRVSAVSQLAGVLDAEAQPVVHDLCEYAAYLLDIGRSVDYYNRLSHTASIVQAADLDGFTQREIALLVAIIREADRRQTNLNQYAPLLTAEDAEQVARCGVILLIADEVERRYPGNTDIRLQVECLPEAATITISPFAVYEVAKLSERFRRVFGRELVFN